MLVIVIVISKFGHFHFYNRQVADHKQLVFGIGMLDNIKYIVRFAMGKLFFKIVSFTFITNK